MRGEDGDYRGCGGVEETMHGRCSGDTWLKNKTKRLTTVNTKGCVIASVQAQEHSQRPPHAHCESVEPIKAEDKDVTRWGGGGSISDQFISLYQ